MKINPWLETELELCSDCRNFCKTTCETVLNNERAKGYWPDHYSQKHINWSELQAVFQSPKSGPKQLQGHNVLVQILHIYNKKEDQAYILMPPNSKDHQIVQHSVDYHHTSIPSRGGKPGSRCSIEVCQEDEWFLNKKVAKKIFKCRGCPKCQPNSIVLLKTLKWSP